jgi:hypothetical protein
VTVEPTPDAREADVETPRTTPTGTSGPIAALDASGSATVGLGTGAVALVAVERTVEILANVPFDPVVVSPTLRATTGGLAFVAVVVTLLVVAVTAGRATVRVGLLFAAVFGTLPLVAPGTGLLGVVAVGGGGALALVGTLGVPEEWTYRGVRRRAVAVGFVVAVALTLAGVTGLLGGVRNPGAFVTLATVAAVGTRAEGSRLAAGTGLLAVVAVAVAGAVSPFAVGSALLVAFAVTGVPTLLVGLAIAGVVAALVAGLRRREHAVVVGALLVLLAGVPATFPRALTLLLGATLVLLDVPGQREVTG